MQRAVAIYRENLLTYSETFILNQGESLRRFTPYYVGTRRLRGLDLPCGRTLVLNGGGAVGRVEELVYKAADVSPRLVARLRALQPSLLHAHFGPDGAAALPLARQLHLPLIVTFHGYDATVRATRPCARGHPRDREFPVKRAKLLREGTLFIAVSDHIRRQLLLQGCPPEKLVTHHIGVDTAFFSPPAERTREPEVLFVGRLVEKKGCVHLLRAMREVQAAEPEARLTVVGDGPLRDELEAQARTLGCALRFSRPANAGGGPQPDGAGQGLLPAQRDRPQRRHRGPAHRAGRGAGHGPAGRDLRQRRQSRGGAARANRLGGTRTRRTGAGTGAAAPAARRADMAPLQPRRRANGPSTTSTSANKRAY